MTRHPMFDYRIMNDSFWIGLYPGMGDDAIREFVKTKLYLAKIFVILQ
jgi:hypothetical protein